MMDVADLAVSLFFLTGMILVSQLKRQISCVSADSYRRISGGLVVLALASLSRVYYRLGMFEQMPFLNEQLFFELATWIAILTGLTLVVSSVANWLPIARKHSKLNEVQARRLELLRKMEQLSGVENPLDVLLKMSLEYMREQFSFVSGAVFKYSSHRDRLYFITSTGKTPLNDEQLKKLSFDEAQLLATGDSSNESFAEQVIDNKSNPAFSFPVKIGQRPVGLFVLWSEGQKVVEQEEETTLKLAAGIIARKIEHDRLQIKLASETNRNRWRRRIQESIGDGNETGSDLSGLLREMSEQIPFEYAALAIIDSIGNTVQRFSLGKGGRLLVESGLSVPDKGCLTEPAYSRGRNTVVDCQLKGLQPGRNEIVTSGDIRSLAALPIRVPTGVGAVLTLASRKERAYGSREMTLLDDILPVVLQLVTEHKYRKELADSERLMETAARLSTEITTLEREHTYELTARILSDELSADVVRISIPSDAGSFLKSRVLVQNQSVQEIVPANGQLIVSLMPLHRQVLQTAQPVRTGFRGDRQSLSEFESRQAFFDGAHSAMIVPVVSGGDVTAVISVASRIPSNRFAGTAALGFVKTAAGVLAATLKITVPTIPDRDGVRTERPTDFVGSDTRLILKSSLTGILGGLDMVRSKTSRNKDRKLERYLSIIDRSARKIDNWLQNQETVFF